MLYIKLSTLTIAHLWREGPELSSWEIWRKLTDDCNRLALSTLWHQFTLAPMEKWQNHAFCIQSSNFQPKPLQKTWLLTSSVPLVKKNWILPTPSFLQTCRPFWQKDIIKYSVLMKEELTLLNMISRLLTIYIWGTCMKIWHPGHNTVG